MILTGQMTREEALKKLEEPLYTEENLEKDIEYIIQKLGMTRDEFDSLMKQEPRNHDCFKKSSFNKIVHFILKFRKY